MNLSSYIVFSRHQELHRLLCLNVKVYARLQKQTVNAPLSRLDSCLRPGSDEREPTVDGVRVEEGGRLKSGDDK